MYLPLEYDQERARTIAPRSRTRRSRKSACVLVLALIAAVFAIRSHAALISANPHNFTCDCSGETPVCTTPLPGIAKLGSVDANAYHPGSTCEVDGALLFVPHGKPIIISDDAGTFTSAVVNPWIDATAAKGAHYEHYDSTLRDVAGASAGDTIPSGQFEFGFPDDSIEVLRKLREHATLLQPGGTLTQCIPERTEFCWNGEQITLMGFSWMGALTGLNFDIEGYLDVLAIKPGKDYGANLTRIWAIEQWTALAVRCRSNNSCTFDANGDGTLDIKPGNGLTPFAGTFPNWNLEQFNTAYMSRLRRFVEEAWERGIVVQLTLFDRHGLLNRARQYGQWPGSPYNEANNQQDYLGSGPNRQAPDDFLGEEGTDVGDVNRAFIDRVVQELAPYRNVIFEIMNEPLASEWGKADAIVAWHDWVADQIKNPSLPQGPGPIAHYPLDGNANDIVDGNHGVLLGFDPNPFIGPGAVGTAALRFDGVNDRVAIQNLRYDTTGLGGVSVSAWVRTTDASNQMIASFDRSEYWRLEINGSGGGPGQIGWDVRTAVGIRDIGSNRRVDDGRWHHAVGVFDGTNREMRIYIDGQLDKSAAVPSSTYGSGVTRFGFLGVGSEASTAGGRQGPRSYFQGDLDDVRFYDRAVTEQEVLDLYDLRNPTPFHTLSILREGTGSETVTSTPPGIDCGSDCSEDYAEDTVVTLDPDPDSTFTGWSGHSDCADGIVTMTADRTCTATFGSLLPEIRVELSNGAPVPDQGAYNFGTWNVDDLPTSRLFNLCNDGTGALVIDNPTSMVTGSGFSQTVAPVTPVAPGTCTSFRVRFHVATPGPRSGAVTIHNNDLDEDPYDINLTGTAVSDLPDLCVSLDGSLISEDATWDFGTTPPNTNASEFALLKNCGTADLVITGVPVTGTHPNNFRVATSFTNLLPLTLEPGAQQAMWVALRGVAPGPRSALLTIHSNDPTDGTYELALAGAIE